MVAMATNTRLHVAPVVWPRITRIPRIRIHSILHSYDSFYSWSKKRSIVLAEIRFPEWSDQITVAQGSNKIESPDGCNGNEHTAACCTSGLTTNNTNDTNKNKMQSYIRVIRTIRGRKKGSLTDGESILTSWWTVAWPRITLNVGFLWDNKGNPILTR